jgi:microsomal dipeptidase-like Zn-dependent dipeptidase
MGAGLAAGTFLEACAGRRVVDPRERPAHRVLADIHAHAVLDDWNDTTPFARRYPLLVDAVAPLVNRSGVDWDRCFEAGVDLLCVAHYNVFDEMMSMPVDPDPGAARRTHLMLDRLEALLTTDLRPYARLARNRTQLAEILAVDKQTGAWRMAVVHSLEGGHALGGDLANVEAFATRGVAYMTITHFIDKGVGATVNALPYFPDMGTEPPALGLHGFGRELVAEMERTGMLIDVTHLTSVAIEDVLEATTRPPLASHASVRALGDHPYSLTDDHIREITGRGGLIGVLLYPMLLSNYSGPAEAKRWGSLRDTVRTVRHLVKQCGGHRHIAIGSDFGAYITPPKEIERLSDATILRDMLLDEFGDEALVEDVMANNAIAFLENHWGHDA